MKPKLYSLLLFVCIFISPVFSDWITGWEVSPEVRFTTLDRQNVTALGGQAGIYHENWFFGASYYHTITEITWDYEVAEGDYEGYVFHFPRELDYGGAIVDYHLFPDAVFTPFAGVFGGGGRSIVGTVYDRLFILEPRCGVDLRLFKHVSLGTLFSWRISLSSDWFPTDWVSGWNGGILIKITN